VNQEKTNEKLFKNEGNNKCYHCREMLEKFIASQPKIRSVSFVESECCSGKVIKTGDITFSVFMEDIGFDKDSYLNYEKEFFSNFMIDFFGEFLVRENISKFVDLSSKMQPHDVIEAISSRVHKKFGISVQGNVVSFTFHISLLSRILSEDLKAIDWNWK